MENKINIAQLLKDCPQGMELDYAIFEDTIFIGVEEDKNYPILIKLKDGSQKRLTKYGCHSNADYAKCVIFPKGKTTWKGFHRPFEDGDVLATNDGKFIAIIKKNGGKYYCCYHTNNTYFELYGNGWFNRFATEEEKQKLFDVIKANGYKWNAETKTLEKLIEPKFKVGDRIRNIKCDSDNIYTIIKIEESSYVVNKNNKNCNYHIDFVIQDYWESVPNKFDINTLIPFESKVLVRDEGHHEWEGAIFGRYDGNNFFIIGGTNWKYCIPYENNEHLFGTTNDCDDYYKTWEK